MEKYIVKTGPVVKQERNEMVNILQNLLNNLAQDKYVIVNLAQTYVPEKGWVFSLVAKK